MSETREMGIKELFEKKSEAARRAADERSLEVYARNGRIKEIDDALSRFGIKLLAVATLPDGEREEGFFKIEKEMSSLREEKKKLLLELGYPADYTDVKYECEKCSDTGYIGIKMCECMKREVVKRRYRASGIGKYLESQSFDNFSLDYYPFGKAREKMLSNLDYLKNFADTFNSESGESLLFVGSTGLGKTHLSAAIAKKGIEKGYSVVYDSAQNIVSAFERERFSTEPDKLTDKYFNSDLLIIDDLGAEVQSKSSVSYFYTLINTRLISSKSTIISTNLGATRLCQHYEDRIVSRLFGEYTVFLFEGEDIRKIKK